MGNDVVLPQSKNYSRCRNSNSITNHGNLSHFGFESCVNSIARGNKTDKMIKSCKQYSNNCRIHEVKLDESMY